MFKAVLSIGLWGAAAIGFLFGPLNVFERGFAAAAAFMLVASIPLTDEIGFAMRTSPPGLQRNCCHW